MTTRPLASESEAGSDVERRNADVCTVVGSIEEIGSKWKLIVLDDLAEAGLVDNRKEFESPVAGYYALTERGSALSPVFDALGEWGEDWLA